MFDASAIDMLPVGFHSILGAQVAGEDRQKRGPGGSRCHVTDDTVASRARRSKWISMDLNGVGYPLAHKLCVLEMYGHVATCRWLTSSTGTSWRSAQPKNIIIYILIKNVEIFIPMFFFQMAHRPKNPAVDSGRRLGRKGSSKGPPPAAAKPSGGSPRSCR